MESIIKWLCAEITDSMPGLDLSPISGEERGKLGLTPEQLLAVIHAQELANWSLHMATFFMQPRLPKGTRGQPFVYLDSSISLMTIVQIEAKVV